jgi:archaemetzincin
VLELVPFFLGEHSDLIPGLAARLSEAFGVTVDQRPPRFDPELAYDVSRGQYNSRILLGQLLRDRRPPSARVLGVTGVDLFIPVLTFVFGEAQLDGAAAVVSTHRLASERYGLPPAPELLRQRLLKEAVHEVGHTCGLVHCHAARCVMTSSTYVEEIDLKGERFCARCLAEVRRAAAPARPPGDAEVGGRAW